MADADSALEQVSEDDLDSNAMDADIEDDDTTQQRCELGYN